MSLSSSNVDRPAEAVAAVASSAPVPAHRRVAAEHAVDDGNQCGARTEEGVHGDRAAQAKAATGLGGTATADGAIAGEAAVADGQSAAPAEDAACIEDRAAAGHADHVLGIAGGILVASQGFVALENAVGNLGIGIIEHGPTEGDPQPVFRFPAPGNPRTTDGLVANERAPPHIEEGVVLIGDGASLGMANEGKPLVARARSRSAAIAA